MQVTGKPVATSVGVFFIAIAVLCALFLMPGAKKSQSPLLYVCIVGGLFVAIPAILGIAVVRENLHKKKRGDATRRYETISNEQRHERYWCAFTHTRVAWFFVVFCGWEVFLSWKRLDNPFSRPSLVEIPFYILVVVAYAPIFWMILRCFTERFVIAIATVHTATKVLSWLLPTLLNPVAGLFRRAFLVLWGLAFLMSLNIPIQSIRHPYIELERTATKAEGQRLLILGAVCAIALVFGVLLYFMPLR